MATADRPALKDSPRQRRQQQRERAQDELRARSESMRRLLVEFQPDAVEIEQRSVPGGARWTLYTVASLMVFAIAWSWWAQVDLIVSAPGRLVTESPPTIIQGAAGSPVRNVVARFGQIVRPGDVLATLDPTFTEAEVQQIRGKIAGHEAAIARLQAERDGLPFDISGHADDRDWLMQQRVWRDRQEEFRARQAEFASEVNKVETQRLTNEAELEHSQAKLKMLEQIYDTFAELNARGSKSPIDVFNAEFAVEQERTRSATMINKRQELAAELDVYRKRQAAWEANWRAEVATKLLESHGELRSLTEDLNKALKSNEYTTIPVPTGDQWQEYYVLEVADRTMGSVIQQGEALVKLAPLGAPLEIEMEIPSRDVARTRVGDQVNIKLAAFPYQKHGYLTGRITTISENAEQREAPSGEAASAPFYRARVAIDRPLSLKQVPPDFRLIPGMVAECEVKVGRRRVMEFFLYPLWRAFDSSIREP